MILPPPVAPVEVMPEPIIEEDIPMSWWAKGLIILLVLMAILAAGFGVIWWRKRRAFAAALEQAQQQTAPEKSVSLENEPSMADASDLTIPKQDESS